MTELRLIQVDAFADRPFAGNPAAVIPLQQWLPDEMMQAIALENNLSETAFAVPASGDADYELRWFTPTTEVDMCGHATLASGHVLIEGEQVRFRTRKAGVLTVRRDGSQLRLDLPAMPVQPGSQDALLSALGLEEAETFLSVADTQATAIILVKDEAAVRACRPDMAALREVPLMAIVTARGDATDVVSRVFVPAWGVDEDPVTGSAHAALTPFWCERLGREAFTALQASLRGGRIDCRLRGDRAILTGECVTVIEGTLRF
jgi:PhzF family phenazine biosynthesis protein